MNKNYQKYFLGANSCDGFVSEFQNNYDAKNGWRAYIIKGGPGCGKSSFMKQIAAYAATLKIEVVLCPCSSDPNSLDAVILPQRKIIVMDGTSPHVVEPRFPGVCEEIINLGSFWDSQRLTTHREEIIETTLQNKRYHKKASLYLNALGNILRSTMKISGEFIDKNRLENYTLQICKKHIKRASGQKGAEWVRFLSGVTPIGIVSYTNTIKEFYKKKIIISDRYGSVSAEIMSRVRNYAIESGYEIITIRNAFLPKIKIDHILIPQLSLAFVTENALQDFGGEERRVHERRFMDVSSLHANSQKLLLNKKLSKEILKYATESILEAKLVHDQLEKYYIDAMDFNALNEYAKEFIEKII